MSNRNPRAHRPTSQASFVVTDYVHNKAREKHIGGYCGTLGLVVGQNYMFNITVSHEHGLVKGMWCKLIDVVLKDSTVPKVKLVKDASESGDYTYHTVYANEIDFILVHLKIKPWCEKVIFDGCPEGVVPVYPKRTSITLEFNRTTQRVPLSIVQLPLVLSKAVTGHKVQGHDGPVLQFQSQMDLCSLVPCYINQRIISRPITPNEHVQISTTVDT